MHDINIPQQLGIGLRKLDAMREQSYKKFEETMPVGLKTMINDEAFDRYVYDQDLKIYIDIYKYLGRTKQREQAREEIENIPVLSWVAEQHK